MEKKRVKKFIYDGFGFPIALMNVTLVKKRNVWTPAVDYNKLQKAVLLALCHKPSALTGSEAHFIRAYFEMTLEKFGKQFGVSHAAVLKWEKAQSKSAKINPTTELCIRLLILEKLKISDQIFRNTFREFKMQDIAKEQKFPKAEKPLVMIGSNISKRLNARA